MAHCVTGLVARIGVLEPLARVHHLRSPVPLAAAGFVILPLTEESLDSLAPSSFTEAAEGFSYLSARLIQTLKTASNVGEVLYFETEYFGGGGTQGAAVFRNGEMIFGPESGEYGPINRGLALLSVRAAAFGPDEFDVIGLGLYRSATKWLDLPD